MMDKRKITLRIGRNSLSFATFNSSDATQPVIYEPYIVKAGIAMAVNLREAFKNVVASDLNHADVLLDTPQMLVPIEQFDEDDIKTLFDYAFPAKEQVQHIVRYNVLPDLKTVCLFAVNKDLNSVLNDRFDHVQYIQSMTPVWHHLHQRSFTGPRNKLYAYFHGKHLDLFSFQQNRFKYCNSFEVSHAYDALYFLLYVWKQLHLENEHDELHLAGDIPEQAWLIQELKRYLQKAYVINPVADFQESPVTKIAGMPYDLMTLLVKGR
jgi:hypothetical protein